MKYPRASVQKMILENKVAVAKNNNTHLTPTRSTQTDGKHGQKPCVRLRQLGEDVHDETPADDEERDDEKENLILRDGDVPEETPVTTVGLKAK